MAKHAPLRWSRLPPQGRRRQAPLRLPPGLGRRPPARHHTQCVTVLPVSYSLRSASNKGGPPGRTFASGSGAASASRLGIASMPFARARSSACRCSTVCRRSSLSAASRSRTACACRAAAALALGDRHASGGGWTQGVPCLSQTGIVCAQRVQLSMLRALAHRLFAPACLSGVTDTHYPQ